MCVIEAHLFCYQQSGRLHELACAHPDISVKELGQILRHELMEAYPLISDRQVDDFVQHRLDDVFGETCWRITILCPADGRISILQQP